MDYSVQDMFVCQNATKYRSKCVTYEIPRQGLCRPVASFTKFTATSNSITTSGQWVGLTRSPSTVVMSPIVSSTTGSADPVLFLHCGLGPDWQCGKEKGRKEPGPGSPQGSVGVCR